MFSFINRGYVVFASSWAIMMLPFLVPFLFLPDAAIAAGVNKQEAAFIASSMGLGSMTGRAGFGFLGDIKRLETTIMHIVPITLFGTLTLLYNFVQGFHNFLVLAIFIGLLSGKYCESVFSMHFRSRNQFRGINGSLFAMISSCIYQSYANADIEDPFKHFYLVNVSHMHKNFKCPC